MERERAEDVDYNSSGTSFSYITNDNTSIQNPETLSRCGQLLKPLDFLNDDHSMIYKKRKGTTDKGRYFEELVTAALVLHFTTEDAIKEFELTSNEDEWGALDDIVFELESSDDRKQKYAMQLKYSTKPKYITKDRLAASNGDFSLLKYFEDYTKVNKKVAVNFKAILYTNNKFGISDKNRQNHTITITKDIEKIVLEVEESDVEPFFKNMDKACCCYKFKIKTENSEILDSCKMQEYETFFNNFLLYTTQRDLEQTKLDMLSTFRRKFSHDPHIAEIYLAFIRKWSHQDGNKLLKLTKQLIKTIIALQLLSPYIQILNFSETPSDNMLLFKEAISKFRLTLLGKDKFDRIKSLWFNVKKELTDIGLVQKLLRLYHFDQKVKHFNDLNDEECSKILWLMDKCPLVVSDNNTTRRAISLCPHLNYVILGDHFCEFTPSSAFRYLEDLRGESELYEKLLEKFEFKLQGKDTTLKELIGRSTEIPKIVSTDELVQMMDGTLNIGGEREALPPSHINRSLSKIIIDYSFLSTINEKMMILVSNVTNVDNLKRRFPNALEERAFLDCKHKRKKFFCVSARNWSKGEFNQLCSKIPNRETYHHLRIIEDKKLEWVTSKGSIDVLRKFQRKDYLPEAELRSYEEDNDVNIVCANPGMGKTTFMKNWKNNSSCVFWTILLYTRNHSEHFRTKKDNMIDFNKFVVDMHHKEGNSFEARLLEILMQEGRIRYLWDGVDELSQETLKIVKKIIRGLTNNGCKQWISSRNHFRQELENEFCIFSRNIKKFDKVEQKRYVWDRLKCSEEELTDIFRKIHNNIQMFRSNSILGIPLQIYILTELFLQEPTKYSSLLDNIFSIADLYEHFLETKFNIYFNEKEGINTANDRAMERFAKFKDETVKCYEEVAMKTYFGDKKFKISNHKVQDFLKNMQKDGDHLGLIIKISKGLIPQYFHNSFGEFLAARHLSKITTEISKFQDIIFNEKYNNIRFFFDLILSNKSKAHIAVLYENMELLQTCDNDEIERKDRGGRKALHLLSSWGIRCPKLDIMKKRVFGFTWKTINTIYETNIKYDPEKIRNYMQLFEFLTKTCAPDDTVDDIFKLNCFLYAVKSQSLFTSGMLVAKNKNYSKSADFRTHLVPIIYYCALFDYSDIYNVVKKVPEIYIERKEFAEWLIEHNCVNCLGRICKVSKNKNLMSLAAKSGQYEIVKLLYENGCSVNVADEDGRMPIHIACLQGNLDIVKYLIEKCGNVNVADGNGSMPIHYACAGGNLDVMQYLREKNANVNVAEGTKNNIYKYVSVLERLSTLPDA